MDLKARNLLNSSLNPMEILSQLRQTTESIGESTEYDENGELVEYEVAVKVVEKTKSILINRVIEWLTTQDELAGINLDVSSLKKEMEE